MAAQRSVRQIRSLVVLPDEPLIGVVQVEDGREVTRYFVDDDDAARGGQTAADARALAGAWSDLDWDEMVEELDQIRHANTPTPPIDEL